jgi:flavin-dependent dehydrogenase
MNNVQQLPPESTDVAIIGGGFAGLTLARQLRRELPELSVTVIERSEEVQRLHHKVGESTVSPQGYYLGQRLGLRDYLKANHVEKNGVRFFFPGDRFSSRVEWGTFGITPQNLEEYQMDRGVFERDLRAFNREDGVKMLMQTQVTKVELRENGAPHRITCKGQEAAPYTIEADWVIDASGRRQMLHRKRKSKDGARGRCSAAWFYVEGWVNLDDFAEGDARWAGRVSNDEPGTSKFTRVNSTNQLCGRGYWVWLIPLSNNIMSIGIVAMEELVPFETYNTLPRALEFLQTHEAELAAHLQAPHDFRCMRRYSYPPAGEFISPNRWAVIGEALTFSDPLIAPGGDFIALENLILVEAIRAQQAGRLDAEQCENLNRIINKCAVTWTDALQAIYPSLGHSRIAMCQIAWYHVALWFYMVQLVVNFSRPTFDFLSSREGVLATLALCDTHLQTSEQLLAWTTSAESPPMAQMPAGSFISATWGARVLLQWTLSRPALISQLVRILGLRYWNPDALPRAVAKYNLNSMRLLAGEMERYMNDCQAGKAQTGLIAKMFSGSSYQGQDTNWMVKLIDRVMGKDKTTTSQPPEPRVPQSLTLGYHRRPPTEI